MRGLKKGGREERQTGRGRDGYDKGEKGEKGGREGECYSMLGKTHTWEGRKDSRDSSLKNAA